MVMYKEPLTDKCSGKDNRQAECNNDIRDWGLKEQFCLGCKGDISKVRKQTVVLEVRHCGGAGHCPSKRRDYPQLECQRCRNAGHSQKFCLSPWKGTKMAVSL
jgi:hypothetical protein